VGNESPLVSAVAAEAAKRVSRFAFVLIPNRLSEQSRNDSLLQAAGRPSRREIPSSFRFAAPPRKEAGTLGLKTETPHPAAESGEPEDPVVSLQWNPGSPIAARTLILSAENRLERIDNAILVCTPPAFRKPAAELPPADIDIMINDHVKGWFFLVRELAALFHTRKSGALALALSDLNVGGVNEAAPDLLGPPAAAAFRAFAQSLLSCAGNEPYLTMGFSSTEIGEEGDFAAFIFKLIDEGNRRNNGKWHKHGRLGFFR
jgi:NAD(P)-dependent dehydrogenase (short-subunit alcohol dehydrogenase family)